MEASDRDGLLLPAMLTPTGLVDALEKRLSVAAPVTIPQTLRAAVLAPWLAKLDWLRHHPGAAAGMATRRSTPPR